MSGNNNFFIFKSAVEIMENLNSVVDEVGASKYNIEYLNRVTALEFLSTISTIGIRFINSKSSVTKDLML